jgi:hypothetical protein
MAKTTSHSGLLSHDLGDATGLRIAGAYGSVGWAFHPAPSENCAGDLSPESA